MLERTFRISATVGRIRREEEAWWGRYKRERETVRHGLTIQKTSGCRGEGVHFKKQMRKARPFVASFSGANKSSTGTHNRQKDLRLAMDSSI